MFVSDNSLKSAKLYFNDRLKEVFSDRELKMMFQLSAQKRLNLTTSDLILASDIRLSESYLLYFRSIVKRLLAGEPFQYIYGSTEFYGLEILCDKRALIPRPETEELVEWILDSKTEDFSVIVDVCTGTGCIALALKSKLKSTKVYGLDYSKEALDLANQNAKTLELEVEFEFGDALKGDSSLKDATVDLIVSNPPYVLESDKAQMKVHVLDFEPHMALFVADKDALIFYDAIAKTAKAKLKNGGWLYFEIHESFGQEMVELMENHGFVNVELKQDLQGRDRMIRAQK